MSELLPCPFCGAGARENSTGHALHHKQGCFFSIQWGSTYVDHEHAAAWNRRTPPIVGEDARITDRFGVTAELRAGFVRVYDAHGNDFATGPINLMRYLYKSVNDAEYQEAAQSRQEAGETKT